jgi:alpha-beta hydrolase superfamily lysophospholipase
MRGGVRVLWPALCLFLAAGATASLGSSWQSVPYPGADGTSVSAEYHRPPSPSSSGVVLFPAIGDSAEPWRPLADSLAARGYHVLLALLREGERPGLESTRRARGAPSPKEDVWRDALSAARTLRERAGDSLSVLVWGGAELGAAAAVVAASRDTRAPSGLLLLSPPSDLAGIPIAPILVGLSRPVVVLSSRDDESSGDAARQIYIATSSICRLWECDGAARGARLLKRRPYLAADLVEWIARTCPPERGAGAAGRSEGKP